MSMTNSSPVKKDRCPVSVGGQTSRQWTRSQLLADSSAWFLQRLRPSPSPQFPPPCTWVFLECLQALPSLSLPKQHPPWTSPTPLLPFQVELLKELMGWVPTAPLSLLALLLQPSPLASHCTFSCLRCQWLPVPPVCLDSRIHTSLQRMSQFSPEMENLLYSLTFTDLHLDIPTLSTVILCLK